MLDAGQALRLAPTNPRAMGFLKTAGSAVSGIFNQDLDSLLSYNTRQQVAIESWVLGLVEKLVFFVIGMYVMVYVLWYQQGYLEVEVATGSTITFVSGDTVARSLSGSSVTRYFAASELVQPQLENGNVFISTKLDSIKQKRDVCEDVSMPCQSARDCTPGVGASCSEANFCVEPSWCSDHSSAASFKPAIDLLKIWVRSTVNFIALAKNGAKRTFYSNRQDKTIMYPEKGFNTFAVRDLLLLCDPPVRIAEVSELGAAIEVQVRWKCLVDSPFGCLPKVSARRMDTLLDYDSIGFTYSEAEHMGPDERIREERSGIRLYIKTIGEGYKISLAQTILKMSTGGSLVLLAPILADFVMTRYMRGSKKYIARKFIISPDFDFINNLEEIDLDEDNDEDDDMLFDTEQEAWTNHVDDDETS